MKRLAPLLFLFALACDNSNGPGTTGTNFSITNRSATPATVVLHPNDWDGQSWTERADTAFLLTVQPGVCTDTTLELAAVSGLVETPDTTFTLDVFGLYGSNTWTATVIVNDAEVLRAARARGQGCVP